MTRAPCGRSPQAMLAKGGLLPARRTRIRPNAIIRPMTSLGSMPAPGEASVPNGRSPLTARTSAPPTTNAPPATWSLRTIIPASRPTADERPPSSHLADLVHSVLDALGIRVPERPKLRLVEIGDVLAQVL